MDKLTYLRAALFLPLVVALLACLLMLAGYDHPVVLFAVASMAVGGPPLLLTLLTLLAVSYRVPLRAFEKWWCLSPFLMVLSCGAAALVLMFSDGQIGPLDALADSFFGMWFVTGIYSLVIGYGYVLVAAVLHVLLRKAGLVRREPVDNGRAAPSMQPPP